MSIALFALSAIFIVIAGLQINDPDPLYWVVVYTGTALAVFGSAIGKRYDFWIGAVSGAVLAGMLITAPELLQYFRSGQFGSIFGDMAGPTFVEPAREFFGLTLALFALVYARNYGQSRVRLDEKMTGQS